MTSLARSTLAILLGLALVTPVFAQFDPADAGRKFRGDYESFHKGSAYHRHAQDNSQLLYYSYQVNPKAPVAVIEKQNAAVKSNLELSGAALKELKTVHAKDAEAVKLIDSILKRQANALGHCDMLSECCKKGDEPDKIAACCVDMHDELEAGKKDMAALKKHLKIEDLPVPKKPAPKK